MEIFNEAEKSDQQQQKNLKLSTPKSILKHKDANQDDKVSKENHQVRIKDNIRVFVHNSSENLKKEKVNHVKKNDIFKGSDRKNPYVSDSRR
jgi:hypothetical protein